MTCEQKSYFSLVFHPRLRIAIVVAPFLYWFEGIVLSGLHKTYVIHKTPDTDTMNILMAWTLYRSECIFGPDKVRYGDLEPCG